MKISVVTASFNQGRFIEKCIKSVKAQVGTFLVEHIILDSCSTDQTHIALRHYQDNPGLVDVRVIVEPDQGQTYAINKGFALATGDVVCWLNTDEYYLDNCLATVSDYFQKYPDVDILFGDCDYFNENGLLIKSKREYFFSKSMLLYYGCFIPSCSTFVRRRVIDSGLLLDLRFCVTMDFDWYMRIAEKQFCFAHVNQTLAGFTWHNSNISSTQASRRKMERSLVQKRYSRIRIGACRTFYFEFMRYAWIIVRILRRRIG